MYTSTNTIHMHTGQSPVDTQSNMCRCSSKHEHRATQANPLSVQCNNCSSSGKFKNDILLFQETQNNSSRRRTKHSPTTHLLQLAHKPTLALVSRAPHGNAAPGSPKIIPPDKSPARSAPKPWRWTAPPRPAGAQIKKPSREGKVPRQRSWVVFTPSLKSSWKAWKAKLTHTRVEPFHTRTLLAGRQTQSHAHTVTHPSASTLTAALTQNIPATKRLPHSFWMPLLDGERRAPGKSAASVTAEIRSRLGDLRDNGRRSTRRRGLAVIPAAGPEVFCPKTHGKEMNH